MSFFKYIERMKRMDRMIRLKATGSADKFAEKIGICRSVLMDHLREMKEMGAPIAYCRDRQSYYYLEDCHLEINFNTENLEQIRGGSGFLSH